MSWSALFFVMGAGLMAWLAYRMVSNNPDAFSRGNLGKSAYTIGILTLLMIGVVILCVIILKN